MALPISLQQALADDDGAANNDGATNNETFDMSFDVNDEDWDTVSDNDGECDDLINDLRDSHRDADVRSVIYFSVSGANLTCSQD